MRAAGFEFRQRFWLIGLIYAIGFSLGSIDHTFAAMAVVRWIGLPQEMGLRLVFAAGALVAGAGAAIRTWAAAYLESDVVHDKSLHSERLVADGPYRYLRNPLYLGVILLTAGVGLLASRLGWLAMTVGISLFLHRLARREEEMLTESLGSAYTKYRDTVPSIVPALTPRIPASGRDPRWGQAFRGEAFIWMFALSIALLAITLKPVVAYACCGAGFVMYFVVRAKKGD